VTSPKDRAKVKAANYKPGAGAERIELMNTNVSVFASVFSCSHLAISSVQVSS
jgi:hypothetical protein